MCNIRNLIFPNLPVLFWWWKVKAPKISWVFVLKSSNKGDTILEDCLQRLATKPDPKNSGGKSRRWNCEEERKQAESQKREWQKWALGACQQGPATKDVSNSIPIHAFYTESDSLHLSQLRFTYLDTLYMYITFAFPIHKLKVASNTPATMGTGGYSFVFFQFSPRLHYKD